MKQLKIKILLMFFLTFVGFSACKSNYEKLEAQELSSGEKYDSLFLGLHFGQTRQEFFDVCWKLNKTSGLQPSGIGSMVRYDLKPQRKNQPIISMYFYPTFNKQDRINGMKLQFAYPNWSPWSDKFHSDKLLPEVLDTLETWYARNPFMKLTFEEDSSEIWAKVDGNRRMALRIKDDQYLEMKITDLLDNNEDGTKK